MLPYFRFVALLLALAAPALIAGTNSAVAQTGEKKARAAKGPDAVPANYRLVIARWLAENPSRAKVLQAQISRPGVWEGPLGFGSAPIACARLTVESTLSPVTYGIGFRFKDGKIIEAFNPEYNNPAAGGFFGAALKNSVTCGKLAYGPFPEFRQAARPKR
jgi:hypothetical protein